jgi:hypothetical protein
MTKRETPKQRRLWRLIGTAGTSDTENGGGVEVVTLFRVILETALDEGAAGFDAILARIRNEYEYKTARLRQVYGLHGLLTDGDDPFPAFVRDGLEQLTATHFLAEESPGVWRPTEKVVPGTLLAVVPETGRRRTSVMVEPAAIRELRNEAAVYRMNAGSEAAQLRPGAPGLRPLDEAHVRLIMQSMELEGRWLAHHPAIGDTEGRWIIDGRHRLEAARRLGIEPVWNRIQVDTPEQAVALAIAANKQRGWTTADYRRLDQKCEDAGLTARQRENKRAWVRYEIQQDQASGKAPRAAREIARLVGVSHMTVLAVRDEMEQVTGQPASQSPNVVGRDGVERPGKTTRRAKKTAPDDLANAAITTGITSAEPEPPAAPPPAPAQPPAVEEPPAAPGAEQVSNLAENPRSARREADRLVERFGPYPDAFAALIGHLVIVAEQAGIEWRRKA